MVCLACKATGCDSKPAAVPCLDARRTIQVDGTGLWHTCVTYILISSSCAAYIYYTTLPCQNAQVAYMTVSPCSLQRPRSLPPSGIINLTVILSQRLQTVHLHLYVHLQLPVRVLLQRPGGTTAKSVSSRRKR
jgi:hypothetical protein